jgi:hypothetical protein
MSADSAEKAQRDLANLSEWAEKIVALADEILAKAKFSEKDNLGFMALCFLSKQIDHMRSIVLLTPSRDVKLIARSMIDGLSQILWAASEPTIRPEQWRSFAWIHDWRIMQEQVTRGETVPLERRNKITDALTTFGDQFFNKKARKARQQKAALPSDPYHHDWLRGVQLRQICESISGAMTLYQTVYDTFSDWEHWGPAAFGEAICRQENRIVYSSLSAPDSATALACGFQCLFQTAQLTDDHFQTGAALKLSELRNDYLASFAPSNRSS